MQVSKKFKDEKIETKHLKPKDDDQEAICDQK